MSVPLRFVLRQKFENVAWKSRTFRKWVSIVYLHRHYGYTYPELREMYRESVAAYKPGRKNFFGFEDKDVTGMYEACADRQYDEADKYVCVEGCCTVLWHNGRNIGGGGPAGCPCDNLRDPRDLARGVIR
jgi:hypothetical protein